MISQKPTECILYYDFNNDNDNKKDKFIHDYILINLCTKSYFMYSLLSYRYHILLEIINIQIKYLI